MDKPTAHLHEQRSSDPSSTGLQAGQYGPQIMQAIHQAPTPFACHAEAFQPLKSRCPAHLQCIPGAGPAALKAMREQWASLNLRQTWADEAFMRDHLRAARLIVKSNLEPATVKRLRSLLRRAGLREPDVRDCVGTDLKGYLEKNPNLPLWAALALILEASGGFTFGLKSHRYSAAEVTAGSLN